MRISTERLNNEFIYYANNNRSIMGLFDRPFEKDKIIDFHNRGCKYYDSQQYHEALNDFNEYLSKNPHDDFIWFKKALTLLKLENLAEAMECARKAKREANNSKYEQPFSKMVLKMCINFMKNSQYEKAIKWLDTLLSETPKWIDTGLEKQFWNTKAQALEKLNKTELAMECQQEIEKIDNEIKESLIKIYQKQAEERARDIQRGYTDEEIGKFVIYRDAAEDFIHISNGITRKQSQQMERGRWEDENDPENHVFFEDPVWRRELEDLKLRLKKSQEVMENVKNHTPNFDSKYQKWLELIHSDVQFGQSVLNSVGTVIVYSAQKVLSYTPTVNGCTKTEANNGNIFILIDFEIHNVGADSITIFSDAFSMSDSDGNRYWSQDYFGYGCISTGQTLYRFKHIRGKIMFAVPQNAKNLILNHDPFWGHKISWIINSGDYYY